MKSITIMIVLLTLISSAIAASEVKGQIMNVVWPDPLVYTSSSIRPWVFIENTGNDAIRFHVQFSIQDPNGKWYTGGCWPTDIIDASGSKVVWPYSVEVTASMPRGSYGAKVTLYGDSCGRNVLDSVTKPSAFIVS